MRIRHLHDLGVPAYKEQVALYMQYALPLANIVVILIGIPFALNRLKKGTAQMVFYAFARDVPLLGRGFRLSILRGAGDYASLGVGLDAESYFRVARGLDAHPGNKGLRAIMKLYKRLSRYLDPYLGRLIVATLCMGGVAGLGCTPHLSH